MKLHKLLFFLTPFTNRSRLFSENPAVEFVKQIPGSCLRNSKCLATPLDPKVYKFLEDCCTSKFFFVTLKGVFFTKECFLLQYTCKGSPFLVKYICN